MDTYCQRAERNTDKPVLQIRYRDANTFQQVVDVIHVIENTVVLLILFEVFQSVMTYHDYCQNYGSKVRYNSVRDLYSEGLQ